LQLVLDSLHANTSIKFAGGISDKDAYALARSMRCEPDFIAAQPRGSFACSVRNTTKNAISLKFPLLPRYKQMTKEQYAGVLVANRARYAVHYTEAASQPPKSDENPLPPVQPATAAPHESSDPSSGHQKPEDDRKEKNTSAGVPQRSKWPM